MEDDTAGWDLHGLRRVVFSMLEERDKRYEQRFTDQQTAIHKQEQSIEKRFEGVNELRGALDDSAKFLMPRSESNARYDSLLNKIEDHQRQDTSVHAGINARIEALAHRLDLREGEQLGSKDMKGDSRATWALIIAVAAIISELVSRYLR